MVDEDMVVIRPTENIARVGIWPGCSCVAVKGPLVHENLQNNYLKEMDQQAQYSCRAYIHMVRKTWSHFHMEGSFFEITLDLWQKSKKVKLSETCSGK